MPFFFPSFFKITLLGGLGACNYSRDDGKSSIANSAICFQLSGDHAGLCCSAAVSSIDTCIPQLHYRPVGSVRVDRLKLSMPKYINGDLIRWTVGSAYVPCMTTNLAHNVVIGRSPEHKVEEGLSDLVFLVIYFYIENWKIWLLVAINVICKSVKSWVSQIYKFLIFFLFFKKTTTIFRNVMPKKKKKA